MIKFGTPIAKHDNTSDGKNVIKFERVNHQYLKMKYHQNVIYWPILFYKMKEVKPQLFKSANHVESMYPFFKEFVLTRSYMNKKIKLLLWKEDLMKMQKMQNMQKIKFKGHVGELKTLWATSLKNLTQMFFKLIKKIRYSCCYKKNDLLWECNKK